MLPVLSIRQPRLSLKMPILFPKERQPLSFFLKRTSFQTLSSALHHIFIIFPNIFPWKIIFPKEKPQDFIFLKLTSFETVSSALYHISKHRSLKIIFPKKKPQDFIFLKLTSFETVSYALHPPPLLLQTKVLVASWKESNAWNGIF